MAVPSAGGKRKKSNRAALADRDRLQHAQAKHGSGTESPKRSQSEPRNPSARPDRQPRHSLASLRCSIPSISIPTILAPGP